MAESMELGTVLTQKPTKYKVTGKVCVAKGCKTYSLDNTGSRDKTRFFKMPRKEKWRCKLWLERLHRPDLVQKLAAGSLSNWIYVCSKHFFPDDYRHPDKTVGRYRLKEDAVPELVLDSEARSRRKCTSATQTISTVPISLVGLPSATSTQLPGQMPGIVLNVQKKAKALKHPEPQNMEPTLDNGVVYLSAAQVRQHLHIELLIGALEQALGNFSKGSEGGVVQPVRTVLKVDQPAGNPQVPGFFGVMPVYSSYEGAMACKLVTFYPGNAANKKPTHQAVVMLYDPAHGELRAILDGDVITAKRTAAVSAVATKHLYGGDKSKPVKVAILGAGVQARSHAEALRTVLNVSQINIWSRTMESTFKCAGDVDGAACLSAQEAVYDADIIVTVTFSDVPVVQKDWVKPGAHINAVGACRKDWQELDPELVRSSVVYVESRESALKEAGDIILAQAEVYAEVGEIINGSKPVKYEPITIFKSLGIGLEDAVSAKLVYDVYKSEGR